MISSKAVLSSASDLGESQLPRLKYILGITSIDSPFSIDNKGVFGCVRMAESEIGRSVAKFLTALVLAVDLTLPSGGNFMVGFGALAESVDVKPAP
jgi:hypothetical protein